MKYLAIVSILVFSFITSCKQTESNFPEETTIDTVLNVPESVLSIPIQFSVSEFEQILNTKIHGTVIKKWMVIDEKGDSLYLHISKTRDIHISRKGRTFYFNIPLKISGKFIYRVAGIKIKNSTPIEAIVNIKLASKLGLDPDWNLVPETSLEELTWVEKPKIKLGLVNLSLADILEKMLTNKESSLLHKADEAIVKLIDSRKIVEKLWLDIQKPIRVNKKGVDVFLKAYGTDLSGLLEDTIPDVLSLRLELKAKVETLIEGEPVPESNPTLPKFKHINNKNDSIIMYVKSTFKFDHINKMLNDQLNGKKLEAKGVSTTIQGIELYGTQTGVALKIAVKGDFDGTIYGEGTPFFRSSDYIAGLHNFDFKIDSKNPIVNSADWLLHSEILNLITEKLAYDASPVIENLPELIHKGIEKGKSGGKLDFNVDRLHATPEVIITTKNDIQMIAIGIGVASIRLEEKVFTKKK